MNETSERILDALIGLGNDELYTLNGLIEAVGADEATVCAELDGLMNAKLVERLPAVRGKEPTYMVTKRGRRARAVGLAKSPANAPPAFEFGGKVSYNDLPRIIATLADVRAGADVFAVHVVYAFGPITVTIDSRGEP